jgi:protein-S-isoprenylcysteine O-methyltransferase Ste14
VMLLLIPYLLQRIKYEEKMLIEHFGDHYLEYMKRTKKLIPFVY